MGIVMAKIGLAQLLTTMIVFMFGCMLQSEVSAQSLTIVNAKVTPNPARVGDVITFSAQLVVMDENGEEADEDGLVTVVNFGDDQSATSFSTTHVYSQAGSYQVSFEATLGTLFDDVDLTVEIFGDGNEIANTTTLSFKETYGIGVKGFKEDGEVFFEEVASGKTSVSASMTLELLDMASVNGNTPFSISIGGNFTASGKLSDDPKYVNGATKAKLVSKEDIGFSKEKIVTVQTVSMLWSKGLLKIKLTAKTPDFIDTVLGEEFVEEGISGEFTRPLFCEIVLGSARGVLLVDATVKITGKKVIKGKRDNAEEFDTFKVNATGSGQFKQ